MKKEIEKTKQIKLTKEGEHVRSPKSNTVTNNKREQVRYVEGIFIKSGNANGVYAGGTNKRLRAKMLSNMINTIGKFETVYYPMYIIGGLICLFLIPMSWTLVLSVATLWFAMLANNLVARGYRYGLLLSTVNMTIYVIISIVTQVWGEVIINLLIYIPLEVLGFVKWKQATDQDSGKIQEIKKLGVKGWVYTLLVTISMTVAIWVILGPIIHQDFAWINALSISTIIIGSYLRNVRYIEVWWFFVMGNAAGITLWALVASEFDLSVLPIILSFSSSLINDFNGLAIWKTLYKTGQRSCGKLLNMRKLNIKKIAKLRKQFSKMKCREL